MSDVQPLRVRRGLYETVRGMNILEGRRWMEDAVFNFNRCPSCSQNVFNRELWRLELRTMLNWDSTRRFSILTLKDSGIHALSKSYAHAPLVGFEWRSNIEPTRSFTAFNEKAHSSTSMHCKVISKMETICSKYIPRLTQNEVRTGTTWYPFRSKNMSEWSLCFKRFLLPHMEIGHNTVCVTLR